MPALADPASNPGVIELSLLGATFRVVYPLYPLGWSRRGGFWLRRDHDRGKAKKPADRDDFAWTYFDDRVFLRACERRLRTAIRSSGASKAYEFAIRAFHFSTAKKNPPSLLFLLMTLGPMFMLLALLERRFLPGFVSRFLIYVRPGSALLFLDASVFDPGLWPLLPRWLAGVFLPGLRKVAGRSSGSWTAIGVDLPYGLLLAGVVILIMYFPCRWFAGFKARHKNNAVAQLSLMAWHRHDGPGPKSVG